MIMKLESCLWMHSQSSFLDNVSVGKTHVINLTLHFVVICQCVLEYARHIANMDVIAFKMAFEQNHKTIVHGAV